MVRTHPVHGSPAVYFHITKTAYIKGMTRADSRAYLSDLLERMIRPEIVYTHRWRKGDVLVIDDRATMHRHTATMTAKTKAGCCGGSSSRATVPVLK